MEWVITIGIFLAAAVLGFLAGKDARVGVITSDGTTCNSCKSAMMEQVREYKAEKDKETDAAILKLSENLKEHSGNWDECDSDPLSDLEKLVARLDEQDARDVVSTVGEQ